MYAHPLQHTHTHHAYTHDSLYTSVYTCIHCGQKGHLGKFYYDKINDLNFASKHVWVRKGATPMDPRKFGYQKLFLFHLM